MKKLLFLSYIIFAVFTEASIKIPEPVASSYKDMGLWRNKVVFNFSGDPVHLTEPTYLSADEVVISTKIYTHGYELKIDTKNLVFENYGEIIGYMNPAENGKLGKQGLPAKRAQNGGDGYKGGKGSDGEQLPGAIILFAAEFKGQIKVNGTGQGAGHGGVGGDGAQGGKGTDGRNADVNCWGKDTHGTDGGRGALGGWGGQGGDGGQGGRKIPLILFTNNSDRLSLDKIITDTGLPGGGGEPGSAGLPGEGGEGGLPDSNKCDALHGRDTARAGYKGPTGYSHNNNNGHGNTGAEADDQMYLPESLQMFLNQQVIRTVDGWKKGYVKPRQHELGDEKLFRKKNLKDKNTSDKDDSIEALENVVEFFEANNNSGILVGDLHKMEMKRQELLLPWYDFHLTRIYYLLTKVTLNSIKNNLEQSTNKKSILEKAISKKIYNLKEIWQINFLDRLNKRDETSAQQLANNANEMIDMLTFFQESKSNSKFSHSNVDKINLFLEKSRSLLQNKLDSALLSCNKFTEEKKKHLSYIFKFTSHFNVPVCNGIPDFTITENIMEEVRLFKNHKLAYSPVNLSKYLVNNKTVFIKINNFIHNLTNLVISSAYADSLGRSILIPSPENKQLIMVGLGIEEDDYFELDTVGHKLLSLVEALNGRSQL